MSLRLMIALTISILIVNVGSARQLPSESNDDTSTLQNTGSNDELSLFNDVGNKFDRVQFSRVARYASEASKVVGTYRPSVQSHSTSSIVKSANQFLQSLNDIQKKQVLLKLDDPERKQWTNLPARPDAGGLRLGQMTTDQVKAACDLLAHLTSPQGYEKMRLIMIADDQLLRNGQPRPGFGSDYFSLVIFGNPSETELWSVQFDGHHVGLNVAVQGSELTMAPSFIGTQPVSFAFDDQTIQPLKNEVDAAFLLVNSLTEEQFKEAVVGDRRGQLRAGPGRDNFLPERKGILCSKLNKQQKSHLLMLIASWVGNMPKAQATARMKQIESEIDEMHFSWQGFRKNGSDVSYTIQSPTLLIEFAYQDLGRDPQNHLHTQYRNPKNDYGKRFGQHKNGNP